MEKPELPVDFGPYILLEKIGQGGMADIYKARYRDGGDPSHTLAVKKILPQYAGVPAFGGMLELEADVCRTLNHEKIVGFLDSGSIQGEHFIAMEHVEGRDLLKVLARCAKKKVRLPLDLAAYVIAEVAEALHYAHTLRDKDGKGLHLVHRDVSPSNILLSYDGHVKVTDFGVAKTGTHSEKELGEGMLKGKVGYMSPEQVSGRPFNFKADVFSLGILLYETATLKRAFMGRTDLETLLNIRACKIENKLKKHPYLPIPILEALRNTLNPSLDQRYPSAAACGEALRGYASSVGNYADKEALRWFMRGLFNLEDASLPGAPSILSETSYIHAKESAGFNSEVSTASVSSATEAEPPTDASSSESEEPAGSELFPSTVSRQDEERVEVASLTEPEAFPRSKPVAKAQKPVAAAGTSGMGLRAARPQTQPPVKAETIFGSGSAAAGQKSRGRHSLRAAPSSLLSGLTEPVGRMVEVDPESLRSASFRLQKREDELFGPINFWNLARMIVRGGVAPNERVSMDGAPFVPVQNVRGLEVLFRKNLELKQQLPAFDGPVSILSLPNTLYRLAGERSSGFLRLQAGLELRDVYFSNGRIVDVHSTSRSDLFGQSLLRDGYAQATDLDEALGKISFGSRRLGEALAETGSLSVIVIPQLIEKNAKHRMKKLFEMEGAWYAFFQGSEFSVESDLTPIATAPFTTQALRELLEPEFLRQIFAKHGRARILLRAKPYLDAGSLGCTPKEFRFLNMLLRTRKIDETLKAAPDNPDLQTVIYRVALVLLLAGLIEFPDGNPIAEQR